MSGHFFEKGRFQRQLEKRYKNLSEKVMQPDLRAAGSRRPGVRQPLELTTQSCRAGAVNALETLHVVPGGTVAEIMYVRTESARFRVPDVQAVRRPPGGRR